MILQTGNLFGQSRKEKGKEKKGERLRDPS